MSLDTLPLGPNQFVQGVIEYSDYDPSQGHSRIIIPVTFNDLITTPAIVDTGTPWCVLRPEYAESLNIGALELLETPRLGIRGISYPGKLFRMGVSLEAARGHGITISAKVFVPDLDDYLDFPPTFVGLEGFLEMIRFAVDPSRRLFYFGSL
jgi:hypothetical protein